MPDALDALGLSKAEKQRLARALGAVPGNEDAAKRVEQLAKLALRELVDWILARTRYESISALERHRVLQIFGQIRGEAPTVESLSNELDISESRAVSFLSRMKFGAARLIRGLQYASAKGELKAQLDTGDRHDGRKHVWISADTGRRIEEANTAIMMDQLGRRNGGAYEQAEKAERVDTTRTGQYWSASDRMWRYIVSWLEEQSTVATGALPGE
jgi:hypothetical protein